jgi:hypothetical protein
MMKLNPVAVIFFLILFLFSSCRHLTLSYDAKVKGKKKGVALVEYKKSYRKKELSISCWLTFWIYGGTCWGYALRPWSNDKRKIARDAKREITTAFEGDEYEIVDETIDFVSWDKEMSYNRIVFTDASSRGNKKDVDPKEFEATISEKPTKKDIVYTEKSTFPSGWPQKWFYETENYKYWTVVGEKKTNPSSAMISSKKKAENIINTEFPLAKYKREIPYETTHNEVKKIEGRYESWRIIRVKQSDIVLLRKQ